MARLPRLSLAGHLHCVRQRGNNGQRIFETVADYARMLEVLRASAEQHKVAVHAYALAGDHFDLLITPETDLSLSPFMQSVGRSYVRYFNAAYGRTGTLWEGRYRCAVVQADRYALACMVAMDQSVLVSQEQGYVDAPLVSSYGHYAGLRTDRLLTVPAPYWLLGNTPFAREAAYVELVRQGLSTVQSSAVKAALQGGWVLGADEFVASLQKITSRRLHPRKPGRPTSKLSKS